MSSKARASESATRMAWHSMGRPCALLMHRKSSPGLLMPGVGHLTHLAFGVHFLLNMRILLLQH